MATCHAREQARDELMENITSDGVLDDVEVRNTIEGQGRE